MSFGGRHKIQRLSFNFLTDKRLIGAWESTGPAEPGGHCAVSTAQDRFDPCSEALIASKRSRAPLIGPGAWYHCYPEAGTPSWSPLRSAILKKKRPAFLPSVRLNTIDVQTQTCEQSWTPQRGQTCAFGP